MEFGDSFFDQVGLSAMKPEGRANFGKYAREMLEMRVGSRFARQMTDEQIDHLNKLLDSPDKQVLDDWLQQNLPNYKNVVAEEVVQLKAEIKANAAAILASTQSTPEASGSNQPSPKP